MKNRFAILISASALSFVVLLLLWITGCGQSSLTGPSSPTATSTPTPGGSTGTGGGTTGGSGGSSGGSGGSGGGGGSTGGGSATGGEFLYVLENFGGSGHVDAHAINSATGALSNLSTTSVNNLNARDVVVDSTSQLAFVGTSQNGFGSSCCTSPGPPAQVVSYAVDSGGALSPRGQASLPNGHQLLNSLLLNPGGTNLYASTFELVGTTGSVSSLGVDRTSGGMSPLQPDVATVYGPGKLLMHPNGTFVYSAVLARHEAPSPGGWELLTRNATTGLLTDTQRIFPGTGSSYDDGGFAMGGKYLVAAGENSLTAWSVDLATGNLTRVFSVTNDFGSATVDKTGNWAMVTHSNGAVTSYRVNADGSLTAVSTNSAAVGAGPLSGGVNVVIEPSNHYVYLDNSYTSQIFAFTFDATTGALGVVPGSPFATPGPAERMAVAAK